MYMKQLAVAAALVSGSVSAMAVTVNIGTLPTAPAIYFDNPTVGVGAFTDIYNFVFPAFAGSATGTVSAVNVGGFSITDLNLSIYTSGNALVATDGTGTASSLTNVPLTAGGSYYFKITGTGSGATGGLFTFAASAAPVPEPSSYALMLAGVAVIGFVALRRRD